MRGIDRRLGLLFCGFLLIFSFAFVRAFWLQGVRGGTLRAEAHSQQVTQVTIPGNAAGSSIAMGRCWRRPRTLPTLSRRPTRSRTWGRRR